MGMVEKIRIGALISGGGTNLQAIIDACEDGRIDGEMAFVGSDQSGVKALSGRASTALQISLRITGRSSNPIGRIRPTSPCLKTSIYQRCLPNSICFPPMPPRIGSGNFLHPGRRREPPVV
jgi:hypothetical protein